MRLKSRPFASLPQKEDQSPLRGVVATVAPPWLRGAVFGTRPGDEESEEAPVAAPAAANGHANGSPKEVKKRMKPGIRKPPRRKAKLGDNASDDDDDQVMADADDMADEDYAVGGKALGGGDVSATDKEAIAAASGPERATRFRSKGKPGARRSKDADEDAADDLRGAGGARAGPSLDERYDFGDTKHPLEGAVSIPPLSDMQIAITQAILVNGEPCTFRVIQNHVEKIFRFLRKRDGTPYSTDCRKAVIKVLRNAGPISLFIPVAGNPDAYYLRRLESDPAYGKAAGDAVGDDDAGNEGPKMLSVKQQKAAERRAAASQRGKGSWDPPLTHLQMLLARTMIESPSNACGFDELCADVKRLWGSIRKRDGTLYSSDPRRAILASLINNSSMSPLFAKVPAEGSDFRWSLAPRGRELYTHRLQQDLLLPPEERLSGLEHDGLSDVHVYVKSVIDEAGGSSSTDAIVAALTKVWNKLRQKDSSSCRKTVEGILAATTGADAIFAKASDGSWTATNYVRLNKPTVVKDDAATPGIPPLTDLQSLISRLIVKAGGKIDADILLGDVQKEWGKLRRRDGSYYATDSRRAVMASLANSQHSPNALFRKEDQFWSLANKDVEAHFAQLLSEEVGGAAADAGQQGEGDAVVEAAAAAGDGDAMVVDAPGGETGAPGSQDGGQTAPAGSDAANAPAVDAMDVDDDKDQDKIMTDANDADHKDDPASGADAGGGGAAFSGSGGGDATGAGGDTDADKDKRPLPEAGAAAAGGDGDGDGPAEGQQEESGRKRSRRSTS